MMPLFGDYALADTGSAKLEKVHVHRVPKSLFSKSCGASRPKSPLAPTKGIQGIVGKRLIYRAKAPA
jgi:hypothetical protein